MTETNNPSNLLLLGIKQGRFPRYLYKYRTVESAKCFLNNQRIMFSSYDKFNDPFEFTYTPDPNYTEKDLSSWLDQVVKDNKCYQGYIRLLTDNLSVLYHKEKDKLSKIIDEEIKVKFKKIGVYCLASKPNNLLMWSHYADYHKGLCLEFDLTKDPDTFTFLSKVKYDDTYPQVNYIKDQDVIPILMHKSTVWKYEEEWRVIKTNFADKLVDVKEEALTGVVFGCKIDEVDEKSTRQLCADKGFNSVLFRRAVKKENSFHLENNDF